MAAAMLPGCVSRIAFAGGVDYVNRIRLVFGDIQQRLGRVQRHLVGLALHWDPGRRRPASPLRLTTTISRSRMLDTYAVALAPLPFTTTQNGYSPPGVPAFAGSLLPGRRSSSRCVRIGARYHRPVAEAAGEHRDRVVVVIRHHQRLAIARNGHAGGARIHAHLAVDRGGAIRTLCSGQGPACGPREAPPQVAPPRFRRRSGRR